MLKPRSIVLWVLLLSPALAYGGLGVYALWTTGYVRWIWWWLPAGWSLAWLISRVWHPTAPPASDASPDNPHWTPRDREAAAIVERYQQRVDELTAEQLTNPHFFWDEMQTLALELARHYHPGAENPVDSLTIPEILAAVRLASADMECWTLNYAPGSRLLSLKHWRSLRHAPRWARRLKQMTWAASILLNPSNLGLYLTSQFTAEPLTSELQHELVIVLYTRFVRHVGYYLIEMNSGRLRAGADVYLQTFGRHAGGKETTKTAQRAGTDVVPATQPALPISARTATAPPQTATPITVSLVGQVSSGKSSLINALTGSKSAAVDVLPCTRNVSRHRLSSDHALHANLVLLDTPGYGEAGASPEQLGQIEQALQESDAVLLVLDAHSPARRSDQQTMKDLNAWYRAHPQLKPPPIVAVLTHVDQLPPALVWEPPYDWQYPNDKKSQVIHDAVAYAEELWGNQITQAVPICSAAESSRRWGFEENLLPALGSVLDEAQCVSLLRAFEERLSEKQFHILLRQFRAIGRAICFD